jgi:hypothetical protein
VLQLHTTTFTWTIELDVMRRNGNEMTETHMIPARFWNSVQTGIYYYVYGRVQGCTVEYKVDPSCRNSGLVVGQDSSEDPFSMYSTKSCISHLKYSPVQHNWTGAIVYGVITFKYRMVKTLLTPFGLSRHLAVLQTQAY